jgi:NAD(P)-dependent dehydrogenase (short-subunit alcohol dehydrogenase family)
MTMTIADKTIPVTGANRGIGRVLLAEAGRRGARRGGTPIPAASRAGAGDHLLR